MKLRDDGKPGDIVQEAEDPNQNPLLSIPSGGLSISFGIYLQSREQNKIFFDNILDEKNLGGFSHSILKEHYKEDMFLSLIHI